MPFDAWITIMDAKPLYDSQARLTILRDPPSPAAVPGADPHALALGALGWVLSDGDRAARFLALTGLTADSLRASLDQAATLAAVIEFLCAHEPDLMAAADSLEVTPQALAATRERLGA